MARKTANRVAKLYQRGVSLKEAHRPALALIDPTNENVGIRYLMQWALNSGALAPFLNIDGSAPVPPHSAKQLEALRIAALKAALERSQVPTAPAARPLSIVPSTLDADGIPDDYDGDDWAELLKPTPQPTQPTTRGAAAGYKPATDAEMKATMQAWEQSLK